MQKAIGYIRISDKDQSNWSIGGQEKDIRRHCQLKGIDLIAVYIDDGQSARTFDRAEWKKLETNIKKHYREIDVLLVVAYDRFSRNIVEALSMMEKLETKFSIAVESITQPIAVHRSNPYFFDIRAHMLLRGHTERLIIQDRTKSGMVRGAREGRYLHKAPFGYLNTRDEKNKPKLVIDEKNEGFIKAIFEKFLDGWANIEISRAFPEIKKRVQHKEAIKSILKNPTYAGLIHVPPYYDEPEQIVKGLHEPIIDEAKWWRVQYLLKKKERPRIEVNNAVPLKGVLHHACGHLFTADRSKGRRQHYDYYYCVECKQRYNANRAHLALASLMDCLSLTPADTERLKRAATEGIKTRLKTEEKAIAETKAALKDTALKIDGLEEKFLNDDIDGATYKKWRSRMETDRRELSAKLADLQRPIEDRWAKYLSILPKLTSLGILFAKADTHQKQAFINLVFDSGLSYDGATYRTHHLNAAFAHKALEINKKGYLQIMPITKEKSESGEWCPTPPTNRTGELISLLQLVKEMTA